MKKAFLIMIMCVAVLFAGCTDKKNHVEENNDKPNSEISTESNNEKETEKSQADQSEVSNPVNVSENDTNVYVGSEFLADVTMGTCIDGNQSALCTIKMPTGYFIASLYRDEYGQGHTMLETNGELLSEVISAGSLDSCSEIPDTVVMNAPGDANNSYTFAVIDTGTVSVDSEKEYAPGGIEIQSDSAHKGYVYSTSGQADIVMVYQINKDWTLMIQNSGQLKDEMPLEQIGQEFYQLVTPVE